MLKVKNGDLHFNYGDKINLQVYCNNGYFDKDNFINLYIMEENNENNIVFMKSTPVDEDKKTDNNKVNIELLSSETRIGEDIKTGYSRYWYEVEVSTQECTKIKTRDGNGITLIGYDENGPKYVYIYPEATGSGEVSI